MDNFQNVAGKMITEMENHARKIGVKGVIVVASMDASGFSWVSQMKAVSTIKDVSYNPAQHGIRFKDHRVYSPGLKRGHVRTYCAFPKEKPDNKCRPICQSRFMGLNHFGGVFLCDSSDGLQRLKVCP